MNQKKINIKNWYAIKYSQFHCIWYYCENFPYLSNVVEWTLYFVYWPIFFYLFLLFITKKKTYAVLVTLMKLLKDFLFEVYNFLLYTNTIFINLQNTKIFCLLCAKCIWFAHNLSFGLLSKLFNIFNSLIKTASCGKATNYHVNAYRCRANSFFFLFVCCYRRWSWCNDVSL